ncbi:hypothetical protein UFOVP180_49 [uncultured Caudovirales phage]|uniref:Uncharacterized protein n=1 Tax=uncultured Caudovirales phage TaxID=2100421 RepID=A0A6J7WCU1_9CAUD|nr:hypothetical protein UFOVP180_49 [uncultured Caudovirales phage]
MTQQQQEYTTLLAMLKQAQTYSREHDIDDSFIGQAIRDTNRTLKTLKIVESMDTQ